MLGRWGRRSWKPWILSLVTELLSLHLTHPPSTPGVKGTAEELTEQERTRRKRLLLLYLLRGPFYQQVTG